MHVYMRSREVDPHRKPRTAKELWVPGGSTRARSQQAIIPNVHVLERNEEALQPAAHQMGR